MNQLFKFLLPILLLTLFSSCAKFYWGYKFSDSYAKYKVNSFFDLNSEQEKQANKIIDEIYNWHRYEELPKIIAYLETVLTTVEQENKVDAALIDELTEYFNIKRLEYAQKWYGEFANILVTLDKKQIEHFKSELDESNQELIDEAEEDDEDLKEEKLKSQLEKYRSYFGELTEEQEITVEMNMQFSREFNNLKFNSRLYSQEQFLQIIQSEKDPEQLADTLYEITADPDKIRLAEYQKELTERRKIGRASFYEFTQHLSQEQKTFFIKKYAWKLLSDMSELYQQG